MQIMANVNANLTRNYKMRDPLQRICFYRKSDYFKPILIDVEIDKSTGFTKQGLQK
jgi:ABC-type polysaccharide transport system permease subunit